MESVGNRNWARGNPVIDDVLADAVGRGAIVGVVAAAANERDDIYGAAFGRRDASEPGTMKADTLFRIASMTKAITAAAAMQLVEHGRLSLDRPARTILPFLAETKVLDGFDADGTPILRPPRREITLRRLLTHTAGYVYNTWNEKIARYQSVTGLPLVPTGRLTSLSAPLAFDPGERWEYGIGMDVVGRMVEVVSGLDLEAYLRRHIFAPLEMSDTGFSLRPAWPERLARVHDRRSDGSLAPVDVPPDLSEEREFVTGGAGLYSTAADYLRFLRALVNGGELDGARILKPETVSLMGQNHIGDMQIRPLETRASERSRSLDLFPGMALKWGLSSLINTEPVPGGRSAGSLTWGGAYNTYYWLDPSRRIAGVFLTQSRPFADSFVLEVFAAFERSIYAHSKAASA